MAPLILSDRHGAYALIRRLVTEYGLAHWKKYAIAFVLMAIAAGGTALTAYLMGTVVNEAYVNRSFAGIVALGLLTVAIFTMQGRRDLRPGRDAVAHRQPHHRGKPAPPVRPADAPESRLLRRAAFVGIPGAAERPAPTPRRRCSICWSPRSAAILLIADRSCRGDGDPGSGDVAVRAGDRAAGLVRAAQADPPHPHHRQGAVHRRHAAVRDLAGDASRASGSSRPSRSKTEMRRRYYANVAEVEHEANKMARVANRSSPLMETLGGIAIALGVTYGGYRTIEMGATPGEFFSFITAFLLAYEPAKRLARLNIGSQCRPDRRAHAVRHHRRAADRAARRRQAGAAPSTTAASNSPRLISPIAPASRCCATCRSSPSPARRRRWSGPRAAASRPSSMLILRLYETQFRRHHRSTGRTSPASRATRCASRSPMSGRTCSCSSGTIRDNIAFGKQGATEDEIVAAAQGRQRA